MADKRSIDSASQMLIEEAEKKGISTMFSRAQEMKPCPIGGSGACCRMCSMGPCRLVGKDAEQKCGVCGASLEVIGARNFARGVAAGASAHSDHGRDVALTLLAVARGKTPDYQVTDAEKLHRVAGYMGIKVEGRKTLEIAEDVAIKALTDFGQYEGELTYAARAPKPRQKLWHDLGIYPRSIDREIVEMMHRTHTGVDQDAENILNHAMRCALGDGWGGSMLATDLSDVLFGTPGAVRSEVNLGVLSRDEVNVIIHGHEPTLSAQIVAVSQEPQLIEYAKSKGAKGINVTGLCCTSNEVLMRQGVKSAGNFLNQELAIITGAVEAMVVDVQCIVQGLVNVAKRFHSLVITTSPKARMPGAVHIQFDEHKAKEIAREILKKAIDNYPNRKSVIIPDRKSPLVAGFSHEFIRYMLGGRFRESFRPLNDNIINGRIQGVAAVVGCSNPRVVQDENMNWLMTEFVKSNVLVVTSGCCATGGGKYGWLTPEAALQHAGDGLRSVCEAVGIPPVLHVGSCVDNSRILTIASEIVQEGGLGDDISDLPAVGIAPEWMSEKALSIGTYCAASGVYVLFGVTSPVAASQKLQRLMTIGWEEKVGGKLEFEPDYKTIFEKSMDHILKKREALGITKAKERVLFDMEARRQLKV